MYIRIYGLNFNGNVHIEKALLDYYVKRKTSLKTILANITKFGHLCTVLKIFAIQYPCAISL